MFVKVTAEGGLSLEERDNFRAFRLVVAGRRQDIERFGHGAGRRDRAGRR